MENKLAEKARYISELLNEWANDVDRAYFFTQKSVQKLIENNEVAKVFGYFDPKTKTFSAPADLDPQKYDSFFDDCTAAKSIIDKMGEIGPEPGHEVISNKKNDIFHSLAAPKEEPQMKILDGSVSKRKDGRYMGRYYLNGVQKAVYASSMAGCITKLNEAVKEKRRWEDDQNVTKKTFFADWIQRWFVDYKKNPGRIKASSLEYISSVIRAVNKSADLIKISKKEIGRITADDIDRLINQIEAPKTKLMAYRYVKDAFLTLIKKEMLRKNPFDLIRTPELPEKNVRYCPTDDELSGLIEWLKVNNKEYACLVEFLAWSGLRIGEALALQWSSIDFEKETITVHEAYDRITKTDTTPKTLKSIRTLPLFPRASSVIKGLTRNGPEVFWFIGKSASKTSLGRLVVKYGIPMLSFHGLRHYFATKCFENGVEEKVIRRWLGHSKPLMTDHYTHINSDFEKTQISKMAKKSEK